MHRIKLLSVLIASSYFLEVSGSLCVDKNYYCRVWAQSGQCHSNRAYMWRMCAKSCNRCRSNAQLKPVQGPSRRCVDNHSSCSYWASIGECNRNPNYMQVQCKKSCKLCTVSQGAANVLSSCSDKNSACSYWASTGECSKKRAWMQLNCRKSCRFCNSGIRTSGRVTGTSGKRKITGSGAKSSKKSTGSASKGSRLTLGLNYKHCGLRVKPRVAGGQDSSLGDWPWQVGLARKGAPKAVFCGGTLINKQWVLTAAHCFGRAGPLRKKPEDFVVRIAEHDLSYSTGSEVVIGIVKIIRHARFRVGSYDNDIALLKLERPVKYHQLIRPACLPRQNEELKQSSVCFVTGWGKVQEFGRSAKVLKYAKVPIVDHALCKSTVGAISSVTKNMVCAGYKKGGIDACEGDSGGPLVCRKGGRFQLMGIVSWGVGCARENSYGVYTKVSKYLDWIKTNIMRS